MIQFLAKWRDANDTVTVHTSGSTGTPKLINLPKSLMRASALSTIQFFGIDADSRLHSCVSPQFIGGMMVAVRADIAGCNLTWEVPSNRPHPVGTPIDMISVVASQMPYLIEHRGELAEIRNYLIGGGVIPAPIRKQIVASGITAWESYGMTETASHIAVRRVTADPSLPFYPLPGITISLDSRDCLVIHRDQSDAIVTNDIAQIMPDGGFIIKGRADHVIISGGKKVHPTEVEAAIAPYIHYEYYISGAKDEKWGEHIVLNLVATQEAVDTPTLLASLHDILPPHHRPAEIRFITHLPLTPNSKLKR